MSGAKKVLLSFLKTCFFKPSLFNSDDSQNPINSKLYEKVEFLLIN